jgi:uncharacterized damage-inducible protein DinB
MRPIHQILKASALTILLAVPSGAQQRAGVMGELIGDVKDVQSKLAGLAKEVPASKYDWRPSAGVRSIGEVYLHLASDNYLLPSFVGFAVDPSTGINPTDFSTLTKFEQQKLGSDGTVAAMDKSFAHLIKAMNETPDSKLDDRIKFFGRDMTVRQLWIATVNHLHEHLGQSIAYARSNNITPPWSKKGS